jgi:hypothetical protein
MISFSKCPRRLFSERGYPLFGVQCGTAGEIAGWTKIFELFCPVLVQGNERGKSGQNRMGQKMDQKAAKNNQREYERIEHPAQFPSDYFFSALAELVLDD